MADVDIYNVAADALEAALPYAKDMKDAEKAYNNYINTTLAKHHGDDLTPVEEQRSQTLYDAMTKARETVYDTIEPIFKANGIKIDRKAYFDNADGTFDYNDKPSDDSFVYAKDAAGDLMLTITYSRFEDLSPDRLRKIATARPAVEKAIAPSIPASVKVDNRDTDIFTQLCDKYFTRYKEDAVKDLIAHRDDKYPDLTDEEYKTELAKLRSMKSSLEANYSDRDAPGYYNVDKYMTPAEKAKEEHSSDASTTGFAKMQAMAATVLRQQGIPVNREKDAKVPYSGYFATINLVLDAENNYARPVTSAAKASAPAPNTSTSTPADGIKLGDTITIANDKDPTHPLHGVVSQELLDALNHIKPAPEGGLPTAGGAKPAQEAVKSPQ